MALHVSVDGSVVLIYIVVPSTGDSSLAVTLGLVALGREEKKGKCGVDG